MKLDWLHWLFFVAVGMLLALFWLTPYTYHQYAGLLVRIHRVTGTAEMLHTSGWQRMSSQETNSRSTAAQRRRNLPAEFRDDLGLLKKE